MGYLTPDYLGIIRPENKIINRIDFLSYFDSKKSIKEEIFSWINIKTTDEVA
ncbi:hypothetical protein HYZ82_01410 [Candidatus Nomurabacteria bacterium]|nr:hypothetical protein [Candidatus Nomurabacteria bacterium]